MASELLCKIRLPAQASMLRGLRQNLRTTISRVCSNTEQIDRMIIAINEASMNIIQHAYQDGEPGDIILKIYKDQDELIFHVIDFAHQIDASKLTPQQRKDDEIHPGGLGLLIIDEVMDEMSYIKNTESKGNILEMKIRLNPDAESS